MKLLSLLSLATALLSANSFASVSYQPKGEAVLLEAMADEILARNLEPQFVFDHGKVFVELETNDQNPRYAEADNVEAVENAVRGREKMRTLKVGTTEWTLGWNYAKAEATAPAYDIFADLKSSAKDSMDMDQAETPDDLYRTVITIYGNSYVPVTITPNFISAYSDTAGYSGGAHDWAGVSFVTKQKYLEEPQSLVNLVDNDALAKALKKDPYLLKAAASAGKTKEFSSATQLTDIAQIAADMMFGGELPVAWTLHPMEQFQKFAIWDYDVKTGEALVRIGLEYNSEVNRGQFEQLGIRVKAKPEAAKAFAAMKKSGTGLFMKDSAKGKRR